MIAKNITKLIDEAIIPALILILAKMLGLFAATYFLKFPFEIKARSFLAILPQVNYANVADYTRAENYSNLTMFATTALGAATVLIRAHFFHASHISPKLHARLASLNLESLVSQTYHLYHQATIWLVFLWLVTGFLILSTILGVTYPAISIIAFVICANFSWVFAVDVEREVELSSSQ